MKTVKKIASICFAFLLIATATVAGTLAYETWNAEEYALYSDDEIKVTLIQQQRTYDKEGSVNGLKEIEQINGIRNNGELIPLVGSAQYDGTNFDKYGMPIAEGYVDQIVTVKNEGTASAYVRVVVAIPAALDDANDAGHNALHWNLGNRFMPEGNFSSENSSNAGFGDITWKFSKKAMVYDIACNIYIFTYKTPLGYQETTSAAAFVGFYLDHNVDIVNGHVTLDGVDTGFTEDMVQVYVIAQAVQSYGFDSADAAFSAAQTTNDPWNTEN